MKNDTGTTATFKRFSPCNNTVTIFVNGREIVASGRDTVATCLLVAGELAFQYNKASGEPRGPYCMMGVCFECLVTIDGVPDLQACLVPVEPGMRIETQKGVLQGRDT
ncbi:MAG: (2Fe-2S)-binding protein [Devosiaceae bacterium]|nr:(2Fe-2S)-binding protein [Devosiaceae bacterium]